MRIKNNLKNNIKITCVSNDILYISIDNNDLKNFFIDFDKYNSIPLKLFFIYNLNQKYFPYEIQIVLSNFIINNEFNNNTFKEFILVKYDLYLNKESDSYYLQTIYNSLNFNLITNSFVNHQLLLK